MKDLQDDPLADFDFTSEELTQAMQSNYDDLLAFFYSDDFQRVHQYMQDMTAQARAAFVRDVLINPEKLKEEFGIVVPDGIMIQRSAFGDRRPTVYCLKKWLPEKYHVVWENTNLTFDEIFDDQSVSRDASSSWRAPVRPDVQAIFVAAGYPLDDLPDTFRINVGSPDPVASA